MKFLKCCPQILLAVTLLFSGCSRDDICDSSQATTPLLIITFKDFLNRDEAKQVVGLSIIGDYSPEVDIVTGVTTDSIAIPLRTAANNTQYQLIRAATETTIEVTDVYAATYQREDEYINRACSFRTIFNQLQFNENINDPDNDSASWVLGVRINETTVENEIQSHITIFH